MGVIYASELDDSVRHVVADAAGVEELQWANKKKKNLVVPGWTKKPLKILA